MVDLWEEKRNGQTGDREGRAKPLHYRALVGEESPTPTRLACVECLMNRMAS